MVLPRSAGLHFGGKRVGFSSERGAKSMSLSLLQGDVRNGRTTFNPGFTKQGNKSFPHLVVDIRRFLFDEQYMPFQRRLRIPLQFLHCRADERRGGSIKLFLLGQSAPFSSPPSMGKRGGGRGWADARAAICQGKHRPPPLFLQQCLY